MLYNEKLTHDYNIDLLVCRLHPYYNQHLKISSTFEAYLKEQLRFLTLFHARLNKMHE